MTHVILWEFVIRKGCEREFEEAYGPSGAWANLFRKSPIFAGTELLRDTANPLRCVTVDRWHSADAFERFKESYANEYAALDARCEALTEKETRIGSFAATGA